MASLERLVAFDKPGFPGKAALLKERAAGPRERFVPLILDDPGEADAPYCSPVFVDGVQAGITVTSGFGHRMQKAIALAYVRSDLAVPGQRVEIEILGVRCKAAVSAEPPFDPANTRLRA